MPDMTITEGLAEIKTIEARQQKKRSFVLNYISRQAALRDPLESDGGSKASLASQLQSITSLDERRIRIRSAIAQRNQTTELTIAGVTRSIADWLTWKREIAAPLQQFLTMQQQAIGKARQTAAAHQSTVVTDPAAAQKQTDFVVNIDERALAAQDEQVQEVLGVLDGKLSLLNATTVISIED